MVSESRRMALEQNYQSVLDLCDVLEAIADALPHADMRLCMNTAELVEPMIEAIQVLEEDILFPILADSQRREIGQTMERLRQEHLSDSSTAQEVSDALRSFSMGSPTLSYDAMGYLLRAFFDGMRRHIRGELELLRMLLPEPENRTIQ